MRRSHASLVGLVAACLFVAGTGCTTRIVDFTAISSKNVKIAGTRGARVEGRDTAHTIVFFPTGKPDVKEALDEALEKGGGDCLIDGVVTYTWWYIPFLYGQQYVTVEGTIVDTSDEDAPAERRMSAARARP